MTPPTSRIHTNAALLSAAIHGDERAWNILVNRFTPALRRVARHHHLQSHDADDVVQATWLALVEDVRSLRDPEAVAGWLVTTARRQSLRSRRRAQREVLADPTLGLEQAAPDGAEAAAVEAERAQAVRAAVRRLPSRQRVVLEVLSTEAEPSYGEVAQRLGVPVGSIGPTRARALARLREDALLARVAA